MTSWTLILRHCAPPSPIIDKYGEPRLGEPMLGEFMDQQTDKAILGFKKNFFFCYTASSSANKLILSTLESVDCFNSCRTFWITSALN